MKTQVAPHFIIEHDDAGQGDVVVLLQAFPLSRTMWRGQVEAFGEKFRALAPDLRGFGGTGGWEEEEGAPSISRMAGDVAALLDALKIEEPVTLCGLSMGGYVALAFAREYSTRLRALILADTRAEADSPEARAKRNEMIAFAQSHTPREVIEKMLPNLTGESTRRERPEVFELVTSIGAAQSTAGIVGALQTLRDRPDATTTLQEIAVPTLVLAGSEDTLTPPAAARALAAGIHGAQLEIVDGAGHLSNLEQPAAFNAAALEFLRLV